jgi:hypothetical protein
VNIFLRVIGGWAFRNLRRHPVLSVLVLALLAAIVALSFVRFYFDVTTWDGINPRYIVDVPGE